MLHRYIAPAIILFSLFTILLAADSSAQQRENDILGKLGLKDRPPAVFQSRKKEVLKNTLKYSPQMSPFTLSTRFANKGHIGIHKGDTVTGPLLGYLSCHKLVKSKKDAILYGFNIHGPLMEITALALDERMAVVAGQLGNNLAPASPNFHHARHTRFTSPAGAGLHHDAEQAFLYETTVFSYDPNEEKIEIEFMNTDGTYVDTKVALMDGRIYYTGDVKEFRIYSKGNVERVTLRWYPLSHQI